jgi:hypothetical protein
MKKMMNFPAALLSLLLLFVACHKSAYDTTSTNNNTTAVSSSTIAGNWVISSYFQQTEDKSSAFKGYIFTFKEVGKNSGTVQAVKGNNSVDGSWSYSPAVTYYGSTSKTSIVLSFGKSSPFDRISRAWNVDSSGSTTELRLSSPEVQEDEHLLFVKK